MKKQNEMKSITFKDVTDIARSTMTDIDRIMRLFSEDTVMRYGSVCQNTAVVYELYSEAEHTSCFLIATTRDKEFESASIDTHQTLTFVVMDTNIDAIVYHNHLRLLDEREDGIRLNNPKMGWVWYCIDRGSDDHFNPYYPGKDNSDTEYHRHATAYQTLFVNICYDNLISKSRSLLEPDCVRESAYHHGDDVIDYKAMIKAFWYDIHFDPHYKEDDVGIIDKNYANWGLNAKGEPVCIDYAYLFPVSMNIFKGESQEKSDDNYIKMDGEYHEFEGGAIRYTKTGKGRFDLIPWETMKLVTEKITNDDLYEAYTTEMDVLIALSQKDAVEVIINITAVKYGDGVFSADALAWMLRDLAVHYEKGAEKYGVDNWKKGIPESSFWDSGCRHTCQFINGMEDEPHWISAIWNMLGYLWTINKKA